MVQVKKKEVEDAICAAAETLFSRKGFRETKLSEIARDAGVGVGNIYSYFPSKTHILYSVYRPWLMARLRTVARAADRRKTPRDKVMTILVGLWRDIPAENPNLANALMEALASEPPEGGKKDNLLRDSEAYISAMFEKALPRDRRYLVENDLVSNLCLMAYDGFSINRRLGDIREVDKIAALLTDLLLGAVPQETSPENSL